MEKIFISTYDELKKKSFIIKFIEHWKDELIIFISPINNELRVFSSICSHFGGEIFYDKKENILRCKWHDYKYCTKTGKCLSYPIKGVLKPYDLKINPNNLKKYEYVIENQNIFVINKGS